MLTPVSKLLAVGSAYVPIAFLAEVSASPPYADMLREGGFVAVLIAVGKITLSHLANRDKQVDEARSAFLKAQADLVDMARDRDRVFQVVTEQVNGLIDDCRSTIEANTKALVDTAETHGQLREMLSAAIRRG